MTVKSINRSEDEPSLRKCTLFSDLAPCLIGGKRVVNGTDGRLPYISGDSLLSRDTPFVLLVGLQLDCEGGGSSQRCLGRLHSPPTIHQRTTYGKDVIYIWSSAKDVSCVP